MSITTTATTNSSKRISLQPTVEDCHSSSDDDDDDDDDNSSDSSEEAAVQPDVEALREPPLQSPVGGSTKLASTTVKTASDSGYSSRTVATAASLDSAQSSDRTAVPAVAVTQPNVSSKKKKSSSGEGKTQSKHPPVARQTPQRAASRNDKTVHGPAHDGAEYEHVRRRSRTSMGPPPLPPPPPPPQPQQQQQPHAPPINPGISSYPYSVPVYPIPQLVCPPPPPFVSTAASPVQPGLFMHQAVQQPRTSSLQYSQPPQFAPSSNPRLPPGHYFPQARSRPTSLVIHHPHTPHWPPTPESPHPDQTSPTLRQRVLHSPTHERTNHPPPSPRPQRPTRTSRPPRPTSMHVPVIHDDREAPARSGQRQEARLRQKKPPPSRRDSYGSRYHASYDDVDYAYDDDIPAHDFYTDMSDDGYDDYEEVPEYVPRPKARTRRRAAPLSHPLPPPPPSRRATDTLPASLSRTRSNSYHPVRQPPPSPKEHAYHYGEDDEYYNDYVGEDAFTLGTDPYATIKPHRRPKPASILPRRPSTASTSSAQVQLASIGRRLSQVESERDSLFAAANRQREADAEQYQAEMSGYSRKNTRNPLEDVDQQAGRRHTRSENRSIAEGSLDGSNMSDALKLTFGVQTLTITQGETGNTEVRIEQNRRQTRYLQEGSMRSSGGTSRSSRQRPVVDGNSTAGATTTKEGKTRPRKGTSRKASSYMQPRNDDYDDETM